MNMFPSLIGTIFYVGLLLINAMAVLSEDRFLARSKSFECRDTLELSNLFSRLVLLESADRQCRIQPNLRPEWLRSRAGGCFDENQID